ncbi:hypothetical protein [Actinacidiphila polyblastidii]|uniref:hypothetical protein n=1 Tax=Actinacidiphila polyblastidii TaxID=3110430 RepID=UPI0039BC911D
MRSALALRGSLVVLVATLAGMSVTHSTAVWLAPRLMAGSASALIFVIAASALLGPLVVTPLLRHGYHQALLLAAGVVLAAAAAAGLLRIGFPHRIGTAAPAPAAPDRRPAGPAETAAARSGRR